MPRSKRNKQVELAKTKKRGLEWKKKLFDEVRSCVDKYANIFVFSVSDMRNNKMKAVREQWKHSRFFIGKNKIMAMALGRFAEEEYKPNLHKLGQLIKGQRSLLFSNKSVEEVLSWFRNYSEGDYARSGNTATETVTLNAGPLTMFPHSLEPYLKQLGLPVTLEKGVIKLIKDHEVCKAGDVLTPENAKILKLLGYEMAEFHITIDCVWSQDGSFIQLTDSVEADSKENKSKKKSPFSTKQNKNSENPPSSDVESMEVVELDAEESSDDESEEETENITSDAKSSVKEMSLSGVTSGTSTPKDKTNGFIHKDALNVDEKCDKSVLECKDDGTIDVSDDEPDYVLTLPEENNAVECEADEVGNDKPSDTIVLEEQSNKSVSESKTDEVIEDVNEEPEIVEDDDEPIPELIEDVDKPDVAKKSGRGKRGPSHSTHKTPKVAKKEKTKQESFLKTPDANTSQDSPIFRELRNRSVKVNRKKK